MRGRGGRRALIVIAACLAVVAIAGCIAFAMRASARPAVTHHDQIAFDVPVSDRSYSEMAVFGPESEVEL